MKKIALFSVLACISCVCYAGGDAKQGRSCAHESRSFHIPDISPIPQNSSPEEAAALVARNVSRLPYLSGSMPFSAFCSSVAAHKCYVEQAHEAERAPVALELARRNGYVHDDARLPQPPEQVNLNVPFLAGVAAAQTGFELTSRNKSLQALFSALVGVQGRFPAACLRLKMERKARSGNSKGGWGSLLWKYYLSPNEQRLVDHNLHAMNIARARRAGLKDLDGYIADRVDAGALSIHNDRRSFSRDSFQLLLAAGAAPFMWETLIRRLDEGELTQPLAFLMLLEGKYPFSPTKKIGKKPKSLDPLDVLMKQRGLIYRLECWKALLGHPQCSQAAKDRALRHALEEKVHDHELLRAALNAGAEPHKAKGICMMCKVALGKKQ
jgi:hypothetical protein